MHGSYPYLLGSREEADEFVKRPDVWWYHYPSEHEDWDWRRGGAWKPAHELSQADIERDLATKPLPPRGAHTGLVIYGEVEEVKRVQLRPITQAEEDDDRW